MNEMKTKTTRQLKEPRNVHRVTPRVCATCHFHVLEDSDSRCIRPNAPDFGDAGDMLAWFHVCDLWLSEQG